MNGMFERGFVARIAAALVVSAGLTVATVPAAQSQVTAFKMAIAEGAAFHPDVAEFYRTRGYEPVWLSPDAGPRRSALLSALQNAEFHGLPVDRYNADKLIAMFRDAKTPRQIGAVEAEATRMFLQYAHDLESGVLNPQDIDDGFKRKPKRRDPVKVFEEFVNASPTEYLRSLTPRSKEYVRLLKERVHLAQIIEKGGWGPTVQGGKLQPGDTGAQVVALRNRLVAMGYLDRTASGRYDAAMQKAVQDFQLDHGIKDDGIAGAATIKEINVGPERRIEQIMVAMERERWLGADRGDRHVLVNLTDFHARIIEDGEVAFVTRSVVGKNVSDRRTPEFSDVMEHMVINPTWNVPRSIAVKEYLPMLQANPGAVSHLNLIDGRGRVVSRANMDFTKFNARNFPFDIKQPPSNSNALGLVKFMFPNRYNIYLHDTPAKSLFSQQVRAYSHGCIRLHQPFDFAYELLSKQVDNPVEYFQSILKTRKETQVNLEQPLPVHIIYRTAFTNPKGGMQYRDDVYGRDARILDALRDAGVTMPSVQG